MTEVYELVECYLFFMAQRLQSGVPFEGVLLLDQVYKLDQFEAVRSESLLPKRLGFK